MRQRLVDWARGHRSAAATTLSGVVVAALVATVAVVSTGYEAQRLDLDDGTVWVANGELGAIGRANADVLQLNSAVRTSGADLSVVQEGQDVLLVDRSSATVGIVDTATATVVDEVPLPPTSPAVHLAGDRVVVASDGTGEYWSVPVDELSSYVADSDPDLSLGADAVSAVTPRGRTTVFSADSGAVSVIGSAERFEVDETSETDLPEGDDYQVTSVGPHWAVLDTASGALVVDGRAVDLGSRSTGGLALQEASDDGSSVLVATGTGLLSVPFDGGAPTGLVSERSGLPARPVVVDGCTWAAWGDGTAWSDCRADGEQVLPLEQVAPSAPLVFDVNGRRVMLSDPAGGGSWAVQRGGQLVDNWGDLIEDDQQEDDQEENDADQPPELDPDQKPPVAVADEFGARPGRASTLPVLLNDFDPNGDPLAIDSVGPVDEAVGRVDVINDGQQLLLTLGEAATGVVSFDYVVSDGRGGTASATVTVTVRGADENGAPRQVRSTEASVSSSGRLEVDVLGDWVDPDGDAFYLTSATGEGVTSKPTGEVVVQDDGTGRSRVDVALVVSDGRDEAAGTLTVTVDATAPLEARSFTVKAYAGRQTSVDPLRYVVGGSGRARLNSVPPQSGSVVTPSYEKGTFRFRSDEVRSHAVEYTITDGDQTATGTVRIDVQEPPDPGTPPVTVPKTVFVRTLSTETIDVTATDRDPAGNVLVLTGTSTVDAGQGARVEALEQRYLRVTLTAPLETGSTTFTYTVTNGLASAEGSVTVVEIPRPGVVQPPVAAADAATVRVGDAIDIDVLANDEQPDGDEITLVPTLDQDVPEGGGLLFTAGDRLRYLAPSTPGDFTAQYRITGADGQSASAQVALAVREADAATNAPPVPQTVTARVVAGESVRVSVPLDGIDPDGDAVQLVGVDTNPEKGSVTNVGPDFLEFEAGPGQVGTDSFTYSVIDGLGARATGTVRIGIAERAEGSRDPVAVADTVTMRPGGSIAVRVLDNDSDPDGGALTVTSVEPNGDDGVSAEVLDGTTVSVTPPRAEGEYGLVYTVENEVGGASSSFVTVVVDRDAPLRQPLANDTVLDLRDVLDRDSVRVDVLRNAFFANGPVTELGLGLEPGYGSTARITGDGQVEVEVLPTSQIVPFYVSHPEDVSLRAYAFIRVPGSDDALPQIDRTAPTITVASGEAVDIDLDRYVVASGGRSVRLTDPSAVRATHASGDDLVVDATTLRFRSADLFYGAASISFEVTDGRSADDPDGRRATLVLPVRVTPRENQPPAFEGTSIQLEPGESRTVDLTRLTTYPYPDDVGELTYAAGAASVPGFSYSVSGQQLTVTADASATKGTSRSLPITVADAVAQGRSGAVAVSVVASSRPLALPAADRAIVRRGGTTTVDVLQNDQATNPFPGQPLEVVAIRGLDGGRVPAGVRITPSADRRTLSVTADASALPVDTNLQYQVADVTGDPDRRVWGNVTVSVQDVPSTPAAPVRTGTFRGGQLTLAYQSPAANNSPVSRFVLTGTSTTGGATYSRDCGVATVCTLTDLDPTQQYAFSVVASNAVGDSAPSAASAPYSADFVPAAPATVTVAASRSTPGGLDVSWSRVPDPRPGSRVVRYVVDMTGPGAPATSTTTDLRLPTLAGLDPDARYTATVRAENAAQVSSTADWARTTSAPAGPVGTPPPVSVTATVVDPGQGWIGLSRTDSSARGGGPVTYSYGRAEAGTSTPTCAVGQADPYGIELTRDLVDRSAVDGRQYTYFAYARNGYFCTASSSGAVQSLKAPGKASVELAVVQNGSSDRYDVTASGLAVDGGTAARYEVRLGDVPWARLPASGRVTTGDDPGLYNRTSVVAVRGCRDETQRFCGPPSDGEEVTPVLAGFVSPTFSGTAAGGTWTFSAPTGSGLASRQYRCGAGEWTTIAAGASASCDVTIADDPELRLQTRLRTSTATVDYDRDHLPVITE